MTHRQIGEHQGQPLLMPGDGEQALMEAARAKTLLALMALFGPAWALDGSPPTHSEDAIRRWRRDIALPLGQGAYLAVAEFFQITAPPGAPADKLHAHMTSNLEIVVAEAAARHEAGEFWLHVASSLAAKDARG